MPPVDLGAGGAAGRHPHGGGSGRVAGCSERTTTLLARGQRRRAVNTTISREALGGPDAPRQSHAAPPSAVRVLRPEVPLSAPPTPRQPRRTAARPGRWALGHTRAARTRGRLVGDDGTLGSSLGVFQGANRPCWLRQRTKLPRSAPRLARPRHGTTIPSICSRRPYLGEASEARQELPPTTESLRLAV